MRMYAHNTSHYCKLIYTNEMSETNDNGKIIKYTDDTVVVGLMWNDKECHAHNYNKWMSPCT